MKVLENNKIVEELKKEIIEREIKNYPAQYWYYWQDIPNNKSMFFIEYIRRFLLEGTHYNSETHRIIANINPYDLHAITRNFYIFSRFYFDMDSNGNLYFNYCAGQDYIAERRAMREIVIKKY